MKPNKKGDKAMAPMLKVVLHNFGTAADRKLDRKSPGKLVISRIKRKLIESPEGTSSGKKVGDFKEIRKMRFTKKARLKREGVRTEILY